MSRLLVKHPGQFSTNLIPAVEHSSGVISYCDEFEMQKTQCFEIAIVPRSEHHDLCFLRVSAIL